jgi:hypothetical protein
MPNCRRFVILLVIHYVGLCTWIYVWSRWSLFLLLLFVTLTKLFFRSIAQQLSAIQSCMPFPPATLLWDLCTSRRGVRRWLRLQLCGDRYMRRRLLTTSTIPKRTHRSSTILHPLDVEASSCWSSASLAYAVKSRPLH